MLTQSSLITTILTEKNRRYSQPDLPLPEKHIYHDWYSDLPQKQLSTTGKSRRVIHIRIQSPKHDERRTKENQSMNLNNDIHSLSTIPIGHFRQNKVDVANSVQNSTEQVQSAQHRSRLPWNSSIGSVLEKHDNSFGSSDSFNHNRTTIAIAHVTTTVAFTSTTMATVTNTTLTSTSTISPLITTTTITSTSCTTPNNTNGYYTSVNGTYTTETFTYVASSTGSRILEFGFTQAQLNLVI
ncbi:hypothetical protein I4U23_015939 [Adineta vaga]|nr:hypothetical protein I4U23_015939 [Adineta vaga]